MLQGGTISRGLKFTVHLNRKILNIYLVGIYFRMGYFSKFSQISNRKTVYDYCYKEKIFHVENIFCQAE